MTHQCRQTIEESSKLVDISDEEKSKIDNLQKLVDDSSNTTNYTETTSALRDAVAAV